MKILWFCNNPAMGIDYLSHGKEKISGTGGWLYSLNKSLKAKVELHIAFLYPYDIKPFAYNDTHYYPIFTGNIIGKTIKKRFFNINKRSYLYEYLSIIDAVAPDVIHIHGTENPFCELIGKTKIPTIVSIQGNLTVYNHKFNSGFHGKYLNCKNNIKSIKGLLFGRKSFGDNKKWFGNSVGLEQDALRKCKYILGRTDWDKRITRILAPESKYFIGNEILRDGFYLNAWNNSKPQSKIVIHTTNGDSYYKGFETLCQALNLLNKLGVDVEWRVAGVSEGSLVNKITKKLLKDNYPEKELILLGSLNESQLINSLKSSHIYVMTSHIENSPNNLCEAMILGMPCIATFAGGTGSLIDDKEDGLLIQDGDPWAMAGAILELSSDWETARQYGESARQKALIRHDKETIVKELVSVYKSIKQEK